MKLTRLVVVATMALAGCGGADSAEEETGEINMSLVGHAPSGVAYRLRDGIVTVQGPQSTIFFNTEDNPNRASLSAVVPPGNYYSWLQEGWRLERMNLDSTVNTVEAQLLTPNPVFFDVLPNQPTQVTLRFRAGADVVDLDDGSFDIVIDVEEEPTATVLCSSDSECSSGQTCCMAGFLGTCTRLGPGASCPLPDLTVSASTAQSSLVINHETFPVDSCAIVEGCVDAPGNRRLMRFATQTPNIGAADMILGDPSTVPDFEFSTCHGHYHFEGYARYELLDLTGTVVATGRKQAFCLLDSSPVGVPGAPTTPRYHCGFQGIQRGWSDVYGAGLDCQWVDITTVPGGDYFLRIMINPDHTLPEADYSNNTIEIPVNIPNETTPVPGDPLSVCSTVQYGVSRDCGFSTAAGYESATCAPGTTVTAGCGCGAGTCAADPVLRVCEGTTPCTAATAITQADDSCGLCPQASFVCPASGVYNVLVASYYSDRGYTCGVASSP